MQTRQIFYFANLMYILNLKTLKMSIQQNFPASCIRLYVFYGLCVHSAYGSVRVKSHPCIGKIFSCWEGEALDTLQRGTQVFRSHYAQVRMSSGSPWTGLKSLSEIKDRTEIKKLPQTKGWQECWLVGLSVRLPSLPLTLASIACTKSPTPIVNNSKLARSDLMPTSNFTSWQCWACLAPVLWSASYFQMLGPLSRTSSVWSLTILLTHNSVLYWRPTFFLLCWVEGRDWEKVRLDR